MLAMAASNEALRYVSYPTQVLGKSCKMVPVMLGGLVLGGRKFSRFQYLSVAFVTFGVFLFNYGKASSSSGKSASVTENSTYGLSLIFLSLVFDAITGGLQDKVKTSTKVLNPSHRKTAKPSAAREHVVYELIRSHRRVGLCHIDGSNHQRFRVLREIPESFESDRELFLSLRGWPKFHLPHHHEL